MHRRHQTLLSKPLAPRFHSAPDRDCPLLPLLQPFLAFRSLQSHPSLPLSLVLPLFQLHQRFLEHLLPQRFLGHLSPQRFLEHLLHQRFQCFQRHPEHLCHP